MKYLSARNKKKKEKIRVTYIDTAKCIAILSMVLGHLIIFYRSLGNDHPQLLMFIYTFHMPSFFIFSGLFFDSQKWFSKSAYQFLISKFKSLIIPYLFLDITGGFLNLIVSNKFSLKALLNIIPKTFSQNPNISSNWFLLARFMANIIFYFFMKYYREWFKYIVILPVLIIGFKHVLLTKLTIFIYRGIIGFTFMYFGYVFKEYFFDDYNKRTDIIILSFILTITCMNWNGQIDIWGVIINNPIYMLIGGIVGTFLIIGISKNIDNRLFQFIGKNTITILGTHSILIESLHKFLNLSNGNKSLLLLFLIIMIIELPWMYFYDKYFPRLIGKNYKKVNNH